MPSFSQVITDINQKIIPNNNQEITANVLRPILIDMLSQPNELIGDINQMNIPAPHNTNVVTAVNYILSQLSGIQQFDVYSGVANPNIFSPTPNPKPLDFYKRSNNTIFIYNGQKWVLVSDDYISYNNIQSLTQSQKDIALSNIGGLSVDMSNLPVNLTPSQKTTIKSKLNIQDQTITMSFIGNGNAITDIVQPNPNSNYLEIRKDKTFLEAHPIISVQPDTNNSQVLDYGDIVKLPTTIIRDSNGHTLRINFTDFTLPQEQDLSAFLIDSDLNGFMFNPIYDPVTHRFTADLYNGGTFIMDLPIESLITNVVLDSNNNLIITFQDGSVVTVSLNTLLVGVVKFVNGKAPNSLGEVVINITDILGLSSELLNKLDLRMNNLANNLSVAEQNDIKTKLGWVDTDTVTRLGTGAGNLTFGDLFFQGTGATTITKIGQTFEVNSTDTHDWASITGKPTTFTPSPHSHQMSDIIGLASALASKVDLNGSNSTGLLSTAISRQHDALSLGLNTGGLSLDAANQILSFIHPNSGVSAGTYNNVTVNAQGHVTGGSNVPYLTSFTETDPIFTGSVAYGITSSDITNWNNKTSNLGTVTSITAGTGLSGGTINTNGTIALNSATLASLALANSALQVESDPIFIASPAYGITNANINTWNTKQSALTNGLHTILNGNKIDVSFDINTYVKDKANNDRLLFGNTQSTDVIIKGAVANGDFKVKDSTDTDLFRINGSNKVAYFPQLPAPQTGDAYLAMFDAGNGLWKHSTRISDLVTTSVLNAGLATKANTVGNNLSNIPQWKASLGFLDASDVPTILGGYFKHEYTGSINNGSGPRTNQSWFDYNPMGTGAAGVVASFDGLSADYRLEISGQYGGAGNDFYVRTRNGDTGVWNPARYLWHDGNLLNPATETWVTNNFASNTALGNYVNKAGGVMQGDLGLATNVKFKFKNPSDPTHYIWNNPITDYDEINISTGFRVINYSTGLPLFEINSSTNRSYVNLIVPNATAPNHAVAFGQLANYALLSQVPTNNNQLANGAGYISSTVGLNYFPRNYNNTLVDANTAGDGILTGFQWQNVPIYTIAALTTKVYSGDWIRQTFEVMDGTGLIWIRDRHSGTTWGNWILLATQNFITNNYALNDGSNLANIANWRTVLSVPTNNNQLANGANYITSAALANYALISQIPTNNNQLTNGAGYITAASLPTVNNGTLTFSVSSDFATGAFSFTANQAGNTSPSLALSTAILNDIASGVTAFNSLGNYIPVSRFITINGQTQFLNNNANFTVSVTSNPTVEALPPQGGGNIPIKMNKTRVSVEAGTSYQINKGNFEGDELVIVPCGSSFDIGIDIRWMDSCMNVYNSLVFDALQPRYFWWSVKDNCWIDVTT